MLYGIYLNTSGAWVEQSRQDVIANNLANVNTVAYKKGNALFRERLNEAQEDLNIDWHSHPILDEMNGGVFLDEVAYSKADGSLEYTASDLEFALQGDGFFTLRDRNTHEEFYTRDGRFQRDPDGFLTTIDGRYEVMNTDNLPIELLPGEVIVDQNGVIAVNGEAGGTFKLAGSLHSPDFVRVGEGRFKFLGHSADVPPAQPQVKQNYLERSNVNPVSEMVQLIHSGRAYEANMRMIRMQDATLQQAVTQIAALV